MTGLDDIVTPDLAGGAETKRRILRAARRNRRYLQTPAPTAAQVREQTAELTKQLLVLELALTGNVAELDPDPDQPGD